jgi:hypothetical protein
LERPNKDNRSGGFSALTFTLAAFLGINWLS